MMAVKFTNCSRDPRLVPNCASKQPSSPRDRRQPAANRRAAMSTLPRPQTHSHKTWRSLCPRPAPHSRAHSRSPHRTVCQSAASDEARVKFNDGTDTAFCPILNGCWQLAGGHGQEVFDHINEKLTAHAEAGFTTFDTADIYGPSESILGKFQEQWAASGRPPLQLFTKYVVFRGAPSSQDVSSAVQRSMDALRVKQLDLVQMHWWDYAVPGMEDTALALADQRAKGRIKSVGVTNIDTPRLEKILDAGVPVVSNQVQFSLLDRRPLNGMIQLCRERGIKLLTYGSLGGGLLSDRYTEEPKKGLLGNPRYSNIDLNTSSLKMYWRVADTYGGQDWYRRLLLALRGVADKHNVSVANVALKWVMEGGQRKGSGVVHPIVGLRNTSHILDNARVFGLVLDQEDFDAINGVLKEAAGPPGDIYSFERGYV
ncbi:unnamed protein product [Ostreobium quekettii]|uniref:NADP-dependent oxidoreductase domain-containing protein n=1 Tax=Ostreobium quekettii TaxID=121088 RepID=A0A8S1J7Q8_9CHLO|nr:unnamed protein product [Ostreobium quekettii]